MTVDLGIGIGVLVASLVLFFYRRIVQDGDHIHFREDTLAVPDARPRRRRT